MAPELPNEEQFVYRALLKEREPTDKSFRLRPTEQFMSIAKTPEKAKGTLRGVKGVAKMSLGEILAIEGLSVRVKTVGQTDPENPDTDLLEITGVPEFEDPDTARIADVGIALSKTVKQVSQEPTR